MWYVWLRSGMSELPVEKFTYFRSRNFQFLIERFFKLSYRHVSIFFRKDESNFEWLTKLYVGEKIRGDRVKKYWMRLR